MKMLRGPELGFSRQTREAMVTMYDPGSLKRPETPERIARNAEREMVACTWDFRCEIVNVPPRFQCPHPGFKILCAYFLKLLPKCGQKPKFSPLNGPISFAWCN